MLKIGLCGRSGSGKSVFASVAAECGFTVIDCDKVYSELVDRPGECLYALEKEFGAEISENGTLNRKKLADIVFSDKAKLDILNSVSHKYVLAELERIVASSPEDAKLLFDAPTLFESGLNMYCDIIVAVISDDESCIRRIAERDHITPEKAILRLKSQKSVGFLIENCDAFVYNEGDIESYISDCRALLEELSFGAI